MHPSYLGLYANFSLCVFLHSLKTNFTKNQLHVNTILITSLLFLCFFLIQLSSRTQIALSYFLFLFFIFFYIKRKFIFPVLSIFVFINIILALNFKGSSLDYRFRELFGYQYQTGYRNDQTHKINMWKAAFKANSNILIGEGIGDAKLKILESYKEHHLELELKKEFNAHNQYIDLYVSNGLIGVLIFLVILIVAIVEFCRKKFFIGIYLVIGIGVSLITESMLSRSKGVIFIAFFLCILFNDVQSWNNQTKRPVGSK